MNVELSKRNGFTLIELLVVLMIIAILLGLYLPAIQAVRENSRRIECQNKERQLSLGLHQFEANSAAFPPTIGARLQHWQSQIIDFVGEGNVGEAINTGYQSGAFPLFHPEGQTNRVPVSVRFQPRSRIVIP
jgi:prepilin-type N-terminal cleavage/methylation domain-containing protein